MKNKFNDNYKRPEISIVCAWYNRADYIQETIDSLLTQDFNSYEIVVVNDGSPDPRVKQILDTYKNDKLVVIHQENTGFVEAIKKGIDSSKGDFVAIQGAGDISYHNRIRLQYERLISLEDAVVVASWHRQRFIGNLRSNYDGDVINERTIYTKEDFLSGSNPINHGGAMFRRDVYREVGGYRSLFKYAQDIDLWLRMTEYGKCFIEPQVLYERRVFFEDGVGTDLSKVLLQKKLSALAKQCGRERQMDKIDVVDKHGIYALFFYMENDKCSRFIAIAIIKSLFDEDFTLASKLESFLRKERPTLLSVTSLLFLKLCRKSRLVTKVFLYLAKWVRYNPIKFEVK